MFCRRYVCSHVPPEYCICMSSCVCLCVCVYKEYVICMYVSRYLIAVVIRPPLLFFVFDRDKLTLWGGLGGMKICTNEELYEAYLWCVCLVKWIQRDRRTEVDILNGEFIMVIMAMVYPWIR